MNSLISNGIVHSYAPLSDVKGSYTAQFERVSRQSVLASEFKLSSFLRPYSCEAPERKSSAVARIIDPLVRCMFSGTEYCYFFQLQKHLILSLTLL